MSESSETNSGNVPLAFFRNKKGAIFPVFDKQNLADSEERYQPATIEAWEKQVKENSTIGFKKG